MKAIPPVVYYTVLRLLLFAVPLTVLLLLRVETWIAVVAAALVGLCLSYLLLGKPRNEVAKDVERISRRAKPKPTAEDDIEDALVDASDESARGGWKPVAEDEDDADERHAAPAKRPSGQSRNGDPV